MNKAVKYSIDYVIEMYPDCPSYIWVSSILFLFWGLGVDGKRNRACKTALNLQSVCPIFSIPTTSMWGIQLMSKIFVKSQGLHPPRVKLWCLWLWDPNSFLAFVFLPGFGGTTLVGNLSGSHSDWTKPQLWTCDSGTKWDLRDRGLASNSSTDSSLLFAKILARDRQDDQLGSKACCWYD